MELFQLLGLFPWRKAWILLVCFLCYLSHNWSIISHSKDGLVIMILDVNAGGMGEQLGTLGLQCLKALMTLGSTCFVP